MKYFLDLKLDCKRTALNRTALNRIALNCTDLNCNYRAHTDALRSQLPRSLPRASHRRFTWLGVAVCIVALAIAAFGELPWWIRNTEASGVLQAVFFRMMQLPGGDVLFRRPPVETRPALTALLEKQNTNAELYSLRALEDEQQLDFTAAESDWKAYVERSSGNVDAQLALADFYHRRLRSADEIKTLALVANAPPIASERLIVPAEQRSWRSFERIFAVIQEQGLPSDVSIAQYRAWIARYPQEESLYARFLQYLIAQKQFATAGKLIDDYSRQFPNDQIFPVKARALVEYRQGSVREGLAIYERSFQPLWDPELVKSYFDLLRETENLRTVLDQTRARLRSNPEDLNATARLFYYYQQQGKLDAAQQAIADYRQHKESANSPFTSRELYLCARLLEEIHAYPESARYYFALYNSQGMPDAREQAIAGLAGLLLTAPETPITFGSGDLSMYRDIATMDQGPGYLNGILSLILNTTAPAEKTSDEEQRALPYFHRARAAELLARLDRDFPRSPRRAELHTALLEYFAGAGERDAVIQGGQQFLSEFPDAPQRTSVALLIADAYSRKGDSAGEFAIYDSVLQELAAAVQNVPLGLPDAAAGQPNRYEPYRQAANENLNGENEDNEKQYNSPEEGSNSPGNARHQARPAFQIGSAITPMPTTGARSPEYARVLERYLARLVQMKQTPRALAVLRREIDHNPDDPGLYERLAVFLQQNELASEQEVVYRRAMARFPDRSWYDKLARFYLRQKRSADFEALTREAVRTFSGSDLERYFDNVGGQPALLYLRVNQYAHERFPHNPVFVRNLLSAYQMPYTRDLAAWEALLRQHWFEEDDLRNQFFEHLSSTGKLESELCELQRDAPDARSWDKNPAAANFIAQANLWQSHFEQSAPPLQSLAALYPADPGIARAASSVFRSLAYFDPAATAIAVQIDDRLLQSTPRDTELMARIGDTYADRELFARAAPYWERIAQVAPGQPGGYLEAATIYWDYYDLDNALRLLRQGRERLHDPSLYAYEAGAIFENQRDYPRAIEEYVHGALAASANSPSAMRLMTLARRPRYRELVDQATARLAASPGTPMEALFLRIQVLEAQNRKPEVETLVDARLAGATIEQAQEIENLAQQRSLENVRRHALEKQIALSSDPVRRLQLRFAVVQLYETAKNLNPAEESVAELYRENPKILGVVRFTVDFYWRTRNYPRAISVLLQAARDAYPGLAQQFTYEAVRKSTEVGQFQQARELLEPLLKGAPYNSEYLAAMADACAKAGDDRGLKQFSIDEIALFRNAPLPADARKTQIAALRRGLIPALTRSQDYAGAMDQYIELINNFPDDDALVTEATLYALRYHRSQPLVEFYARTITQSPRDYRWPMVLARIHTNLENYSSAIDDYAKAITVRPDRADLYTARAGLEERLMRFDDAASDYERIYELAYKDPQWMERVAGVRARKGKEKEVVDALRVALLDGRPENANNYFEVARRLESWGMLATARGVAERGVKTAGSDLLAASEYRDGVRAYVRIMTRLRQHEQALSVIQPALASAASPLPVIKEQIERQGIAAITDAQWRERLHQNRINTARDGMAAALEEMGTAVDSYFTPEERRAFASFAESQWKSANSADLQRFGITLAQTAALSDLESRWRFQLLMSEASTVPQVHSDLQSFIDLQRRRGRFAEFAQQMEQYAAALPAAYRSAALIASADAYRSAGDEAGELRLLSLISAYSLDREPQQRLFQLLLARQPQQLVAIASGWKHPAADSAADFVLANGGPDLAHQVVRARGQARPVVWARSYNALVGLYFDEQAAAVDHSFLGALGNGTIAERLSKRVNRDEQLAGNTWFYYGSGYGEYLAASRRARSEDYLPAMLERSPASSSAYLALADYYAGVNDTARAVADYDHVLELSPNRPDVYDRLAVVYDRAGDRTAAIARWKQAFALLLTQAQSGHVSETFWSDFGRTCDQLRQRRLYAGLRPDADVIVRAYLQLNGTWRSNAVLQPAYMAIGDSAAATAWLLDISSAAQDSTQVLADVADARWIPLSARGPIYQRILESKQKALAGLSGVERETAQEDIHAWQVRWIKYLIDTGNYRQAADAIAALPKSTYDSRAGAFVTYDLEVAAQLGRLDQKIAGYRSQPQTAPTSELLRAAAQKLSEKGDRQSARAILEFVFAREIDAHNLNAANFMGLAEIRLASGDTSGALDLLRRLTVVGNPFENLDPAAALLEKAGRNREAIEFLDQLVRSAPWDASSHLRLAKAKIAAGVDVPASRNAVVSIASAAGNSYGVRIRAAQALAGKNQTDLGSGELTLLAATRSASSPDAADRSWFYEARIRAAQNASEPATRVRLLSHSIADFPRRDAARLPLFQAAAGQRSDEFALVVLEPVVAQRFARRPYSRFDSEETTDDTDVQQKVESDDAQMNSDEEQSAIDQTTSENSRAQLSPLNATIPLSRSERASIAETMAESLSRLNRLSDAIPYFEIARKLQTSAAARKRLGAKIADARAELRRRRQNAARRPILHEALEQDRVVRPRLVPRASPHRPQAPQGAVQP